VFVLADTHNRLPEEVRAMAKDADEIWHLVDVFAQKRFLTSCGRSGRRCRCARKLRQAISSGHSSFDIVRAA
jgi:hypothetical protein